MWERPIVYQTLYGIVLYVWRGRKVKVRYGITFRPWSITTWEDPVAYPPVLKTIQNQCPPLAHFIFRELVRWLRWHSMDILDISWDKWSFFGSFALHQWPVRDLSSWNWDSPPVGSCPGPGFACPACCAPSGTSRPKIHWIGSDKTYSKWYLTQSPNILIEVEESLHKSWKAAVYLPIWNKDRSIYI